MDSIGRVRGASFGIAWMCLIFLAVCSASWDTHHYNFILDVIGNVLMVVFIGSILTFLGSFVYESMYSK